MTVARQPSNVPAHWIPRLSNICTAKRGKPAPAKDRRTEFAAMTEAALELEISIKAVESIGMTSYKIR